MDLHAVDFWYNQWLSAIYNEIVVVSANNFVFFVQSTYVNDFECSFVVGYLNAEQILQLAHENMYRCSRRKTINEWFAKKRCQVSQLQNTHQNLQFG